METYQERYTYLDNIRNILVYCVVFYHTIALFSYPFTFWWSDIDIAGSSKVYETLIMTLDVFLMPHLLFIAAFFILYSMKNKSKLEYLKKRFSRLVVPIIIFLFCGGDIAYQLLSQRLVTVDPTYISTFIGYWTDFIDVGVVTFIGENKMLDQISFNMIHAWFLSVLFFMSLFVIPFGKKEPKQATIDSRRKIIVKVISLSLVLAVLFTAIGISLSVNKIRFDSWIRVFAVFQIRIDQFLLLLPLFLLGLYMYRKDWLTKGDLGDWKMWGALSAVLIFAHVMIINTGHLETLNEILKVAENNLTFKDQRPFPVITDSFKQSYFFLLLLKAPMCMFLLMFFLSFAKRFFNKANKITAFCSTHSINVYILHLVPVFILQHSVVNLAFAPIIKTILMLIIIISACLWLSYRFVTPYPFAAIGFFVLLKVVSLFAGFDFYYKVLLGMIIISFAGAVIESIRLLMPAQVSRQGA